MPKDRKKTFQLGIKLKLLIVFLPVITVGVTAILIMVYYNVSKIVLAKSEELLSVNTADVATQVENWVEQTLTALNNQRDAIEFIDMTPEEELAYIKHTSKRYDAFPAGIFLATLDGKLIHTSFVPGPEYNVFEKPWYQGGLKSEKFVFGDIYFDSDSKSYVVGASGVLKDKSGNVRGVAAADIYLSAISQIVAPVKLGDSGGIFLVDTATNMVIGHGNPALVGTYLQDSEDALYTHAAELLSSNASGVQTYVSPDGNSFYMNVVPVEGSNWSAIAYIPHGEVVADLNNLTWLLVLIAVVAILLLILAISLTVKRLVIKPVRQIDGVAREIADGMLNKSIDYKSNDEFGMLADNFNKTVTRLRDYVNYIDEISDVLNSIAQGNLIFELSYEYAGEFARIKYALENISESMNKTMGQIQRASEQVTSGSHQIADGASSLAQGATQQAASVESLALKVNEIAEKLEKNAVDATSGMEQSTKTGEEIMGSNQKMQELILAITQISGKSAEISKIIKTIDDIAFQTNILALNAAVEAARAGSAGKGFAVVADEVRNLAGKSATAAKDTTALIEDTIRAVENGTQVAGETADAMLSVVENSRKVTQLMQRITASTDEQAGALALVSSGVDKISAVVQQNSATAEQSAAASEELSGQAEELRRLVSEFHLKNNDEIGAYKS